MVKNCEFVLINIEITIQYLSSSFQSFQSYRRNGVWMKETLNTSPPPSLYFVLSLAQSVCPPEEEEEEKERERCKLPSLKVTAPHATLKQMITSSNRRCCASRTLKCPLIFTLVSLAWGAPPHTHTHTPFSTAVDKNLISGFIVVCILSFRLLKRLDFPEMKFSLYFMGYVDEALIPTDETERTRWLFQQAKHLLFWLIQVELTIWLNCDAHSPPRSSWLITGAQRQMKSLPTTMATQSLVVSFVWGTKCLLRIASLLTCFLTFAITILRLWTYWH